VVRFKNVIVFFGAPAGGEQSVAYPAKTGKEGFAGKRAGFEMVDQALPIVTDILFQEKPAVSQFFPFQL
jgi:hypothetical protein